MHSVTIAALAISCMTLLISTYTLYRVIRSK